MCSLLRTTLLRHARHGSDITEPTRLGLLAITGVLEERLTRLDTPIRHQSLDPPIKLATSLIGLQPGRHARPSEPTISIVATTPTVATRSRTIACERGLPTRSYPGIAHVDFKIDNMMVERTDPTRILGVLDWEMSTLGDTVTDLGILCSFWDHEGEFFNPITAGATALPGFPTRDQLIDRYMTARRIDIPDIDWYLVLADFKIAVIFEVIHARHAQGYTAGEDFTGVGDIVGPLLDRAYERATTSSVSSLAG